MKITVKPGNAFSIVVDQETLVDYTETAYGFLIAANQHEKIVSPTRVPAGTVLFMLNSCYYPMELELK